MLGSLCKGEKKEKDANIISFRLNIYILSISKMGGGVSITLFTKDILKKIYQAGEEGAGLMLLYLLDDEEK